MPKCRWCKEDGERDDMVVYATPTGIMNKNGTERMRRAYYHPQCDEEFKANEAFKRRESEELDELYQHILEIHELETLDGRMFEKIQDFRNGTIKVNNRKIRKSKEGVTYKLMLDTYKHIAKTVDNVLRTRTFQAKWNEFSYVFGIMVNNVNDVIQMQRKNDAVKIPKEIVSKDFNIEIPSQKNRSKRQDELDISDFL